MKTRLSAPLALLVLPLALAGQAEARTTPLAASRIATPASATGVDTVAVQVRVRNTAASTIRGGSLYAGLTTGTTARKSVKRLASRVLTPLRSGKSRSLTLRIPPRIDRGGPYRVVVCARSLRASARCAVSRPVSFTKGAPAGQAPPVQTVTVTTPPPTPPPAPAPLTTSQARAALDTAITADSLTKHTEALDAIGAANGGTRVAGSQGYDDSALYIINELNKAGYEPRLDRFDFVIYNETADPTLTLSAPLTAGTAGKDFISMSYSGGGQVPAGTRVVPIDLGTTPTPDTAPPSSNTSGCEDADFTNVSFPRGAIALMKRGTCGFVDKATNAIEAGAAGVLIFNEGQPGRDELLNGTLGGPIPGGANVPVLGLTAALGEAIAGATPAATAGLSVTATNDPGSSYNVIADTPGGDPDSTVIVGSHLDSVDAGPGVNDNGSGSALNLELALQMSKLGVTPTHRVRFAWWGAEEAGLIGSTAYGSELSEEEFAQVGLNLNYDMLGSPNYARLIYDGDFSDSLPPAGVAALAPGSADVEAAFERYFTSKGLATEPTGFDGRSDYQVFQNGGVPAGGLFSGAEEIKSAEEVGLFGGLPDVAFDENYHEAGDDAGNINREGFEQLGKGAALVAFDYATGGPLPAKFDENAPGRRSAAKRSGFVPERVGDKLAR